MARQLSAGAAHLRVLVAIVLLALNLRTVIASLPPLLSTVRDDLGLSATAAGLLTTLPVLCFGALAPLAPRLARRVSLERVLVACAALTAVAAALRGLGDVSSLFAGSLLAGVAVAINQAALPVLIRLAYPQATGRLTGAYSMALPLGAMLGGGLAVPLARALGNSWEASLAAWALPAALAAALWLPPALAAGTRVTGPPPAPLRGIPLAWAVAGLFGVQSMQFYATLAWLPEILESEGWSAGAAGGLQALANLVSIAPAFAVPVLAARTRTQIGWLYVVTAVNAAGVLGLLAAPEAAPAWVVLIGLGQGGVLGLALIVPVLRAGDAATVASLTAMAFCFGYLVAAAGPWLIGIVHDAFGGWSEGLLVVLAITLLQLVPGLPASRPGQVGEPSSAA